MQSQAKSVEQYLAELPEDRRQALTAIRNAILRNLDKNYQEGMQYGMIAYYVPHRVYPAGYHCDPKQPLPYVCLASHKNHISLYLMSVYSDPAELSWFQQAWKAAGKKLDMGKSCVRFKKLEDAPLDVIGEAIKRMPADRHIAVYESALKRETPRTSKSRTKTTPPKQSAASKPKHATAVRRKAGK